MRQIIILSNSLTSDGNIQYSYVYWLSVPVALQKANPTFTTVVPTATAQEITALQNGTVLEQIFSKETSNYPDIPAALVREYNVAQNFLNNQATIKNYTGVYYDGTWHNVPA